MAAEAGQQFNGSAEGPKPPEGHSFFSAFHDHPIKAGGKCVTNCGMRKVKPGNNRLFDAHIAAEEAGTHSVMLGHSDPRTGRKLPVYSFGPKVGLEKVKTKVKKYHESREGPTVEQATSGVRLTKRGKPWVGRGHHPSPNRGGRNKKSGEAATNRKKKD